MRPAFLSLVHMVIQCSLSARKMLKSGKALSTKDICTCMDPIRFIWPWVIWFTALTLIVFEATTEHTSCLTIWQSSWDIATQSSELVDSTLRFLLGRETICSKSLKASGASSLHNPIFIQLSFWEWVTSLSTFTIFYEETHLQDMINLISPHSWRIPQHLTTKSILWSTF